MIVMIKLFMGCYQEQFFAFYFVSIKAQFQPWFVNHIADFRRFAPNLLCASLRSFFVFSWLATVSNIQQPGTRSIQLWCYYHFKNRLYGLVLRNRSKTIQVFWTILTFLNVQIFYFCMDLGHIFIFYHLNTGPVRNFNP